MRLADIRNYEPNEIEEMIIIIQNYNISLANIIGR